MTYLALDVHKTHSTVAYLDPSRQVQIRKIYTRRHDLAQMLAKLPRPWIVALEATRQSPAVCAWLRELDAEIHLVDPQKLSALAALRTAKTDAKDAELMLDALRHDYLPEADLASPEVAERRDLIRCHTAVRRVSTYLRNLRRSRLARQGEELVATDLCGQGAQALLDELEETLAAVPALVCRVYRRVLAEVEQALRVVDAQIKATVAVDPLAQRLLAQPGKGPLTTLGMLAEIGDPARFPSYKQLISYAGLAPRVYQSGDSCATGHLPQRCSRRLRHGAVLAAQCAARSRKPSPARHAYQRVCIRHGPNAAKIAAAREMLRDVYFAAQRQRAEAL
jgi:transposase